MTSVVRDPRHPDFPHGTNVGYHRGCVDPDDCPSTPTCWLTHKQRRYELETQGPERGFDPTLMFDHIEQLLADGHASSRHHILDTAGVGIGSIQHATRYGVTTRSISERILAVTPEDLAATLPTVPAERICRYVRLMQAQGFSMAWIEREVKNKNIRSFFRKTRTIQRGTRALHDKLEELFLRLDGRMASTSDGLTPSAIGFAKTQARRAGYYPSAAYDEDGNLDPRAVPGHPWAEADDRCAELMEIAHSLATLGSRAAAVRATGDRPGDEQKVTRVIENLGMTFRYTVIDETTKKVSRFIYEPHEARRVNREVFDHIEAAWEQYESGAIGPVYAALVAGVAKLDSRGRAALPKDHPEVIEYIADHPADEDQDDMATAA